MRKQPTSQLILAPCAKHPPGLAGMFVKVHFFGGRGVTVFESSQQEGSALARQFWGSGPQISPAPELPELEEKIAADLPLADSWCILRGTETGAVLRQSCHRHRLLCAVDFCMSPVSPFCLHEPLAGWRLTARGECWVANLARMRPLCCAPSTEEASSAPCPRPVFPMV